MMRSVCGDRYRAARRAAASHADIRAVGNGPRRLGLLLGILGPAIVVAWALVLVVGLPMHLALVRQRRTRARDYALAGSLLGAVPALDMWWLLWCSKHSSRSRP